MTVQWRGKIEEANLGSRRSMTLREEGMKTKTKEQA